MATMKILLIVLLLSSFCLAQTVELSALNYGGDWKKADAKLMADVQAIINGLPVDGKITFLYHYIYTADKTSIPIFDTSQSIPIERWVTVSNEKVTECPVTLEYSTIQANKLPSHIQYSTWDGGKEPCGIAPLTEWQKVEAIEVSKEVAIEADALVKKLGDKAWTVNGKAITDEKAKLEAAWQVVTGRIDEKSITATTAEPKEELIEEIVPK
jgi:hypothetical protein